MSGKFVRASKYRHVFGQAAKKELQYEKLKVTNNAWDSNLLKTNGKFIAVNWNASGGGAFAVIPIEEVGKAPDQVPLFRGHTAQVLDTDFDPFNDYRIASGSDDSKIGIWDIPENYKFHDHVDEDGEPIDIKPVKFLTGHARKVGHVLYHPVAENVLASSSGDYTVKLWNVETGKDMITLKHPDMVTSMSFSYDGNYLATVARDKKLRVWNIREEKIVSEGPAHTGAKNQRVVWLGNSDRLATTGFSKLSDRQIGIWDAFNIEKGDLGGFYTVDQSSGILMPFYDEGNKILYLVGKGDGNIRYYEFQNDELFELSEFQSTEAQRGFAVAPKRMVNVKENEVLKGFKTVVDQRIEPVSFFVPRRSEEFQEDIYPDAPSNKPALTAEEWFSGKSVEGPILVSMRSIYDGSAPSFHEAKRPQQPTTQETALEEKKEQPKVEKPISESEKEVKQEAPKSPSPLKSASSSSTINHVLKEDNSINKLLKKSSDIDQVNNAEDPSRDTSGWEEADDEPAPIKIETPATPTETKKDRTPKVEPSKELKPEPVSIATDRKQEQSLPQEEKSSEKTKSPEQEKSATPPSSMTAAKTAITASSKEEPSAAKTSPKSLGLKQSVEKLSTLVLQLEDVVDKLMKANLDKDERLLKLEQKIGELSK
ncbi:CLL_collapsed_G0039150.mRNA.1.CDS.1 [Saccharomyces cerevisiae]|uniref:Coronin n=1 Tax=Saccharomyces cerevisiae (strain Kyokai no. 7 / NBRC 101557) TaxID=721032 RepID=G2WJP0_YEASK|nr:Crn1p [Saccharomyces cerevisiae YJM1387]CAI4647151.1 ADQ_G0038740.mRNA.1.CDS.1 [Saccharomyces cerevisiae]GAA25283.1 K7_Crn1p [Saccharomyces cerevisiae Kyokai no. 7]CAI4654316.1 CLN_G0039110.mRNA.1.CDS.1 [Saccharomyces cerevisiae]CAI5295042.1 CLL_HP2_G0033930.mRNA.1.CDS.1 [Saccharomyces cerevisiae]